MTKNIQNTHNIENSSKNKNHTDNHDKNILNLVDNLENTKLENKTQNSSVSSDIPSENKHQINQTENRLAIFIAENDSTDNEDKDSSIVGDINNSSNNLGKNPIISSSHNDGNKTDAMQYSSNSYHEKTSISENSSTKSNPAKSDENTEEAEGMNVSYLDPESDPSYDPCDPAYAESESFHPADRADQLESLSFEKQLCMLTRMDTEDAAEAIAELDGTVARNLIENLDAEDAAKILSAMDPDDAVDVLDDVEEGHRDVLLSNLAPEEAMELRALLAFDPDTAAGVMNTEIIIISQDESVDDAIHHIRLELEDKDMPYYVYAVDEHDILVGIISLRELMLSKPNTFIKELLSEKRNLITAQYDLDKLEVARLLSHYNFLALPVIDKEGHLMGAVTHDDVIDIIQEEASSDLLGMVGAGQDEDIYTPWTKSVKLRLPWLFINMFNSSISAYIVYLFQGSIAQMAFLAVLMPMVANQAGNTGQQALAVMIRQLATEKFDSKKSWKAVLRESKIGLFTGFIMALFSIGIIWMLADNIILGCIMGGSLMLDMLLGSIAGGSIPLILRALGRDPAQASSIFLTAITDGAGFFIFLSLATIFVL